MNAMNSNDNHEYAIWLIARKARRLCRRRGMSLSDIEDIEQELRIHVELRLARWDSEKACQRTFIDRIIRRRLVSIIRYRFAEKRTPEREDCSLNDPVLDESGRMVDRHQTTPEAASTRQRLQDLARDLADLRERLPSETHRRFMDALGRGGSVNSIGAELGLSRRAAARHFADLQRLFEDAGLRVYL
ncbi:MAG: hypothetical protein KF768_05435 [Phycisphaeraceae bacterium]|nr:hypothetical protein [Phycisphaeraceae bacterium]